MVNNPGVPKECFEQYGQDLDGCSTQENEGCSRCRLLNGSGDASEGEEKQNSKLN